MDRRDFIKLTAITGTSATLASCGNPGASADPLRARRGHRARRGGVEAERLPDVRGRLRHDRARHGSRRRDHAQRPGRRRQDGAWRRSSKATPKDPISQGGLCARGQASIQITYHPDRLTQPMKRTGARGAGEFKEITWDEAIAELTGQLDALAAAGDQKSLAFLTRPHRGRRHRARRGVRSRASARRAPIAYELFGDDVLRRANAISFGHEQLPTVDLGARALRDQLRRRFPRHLELAGRAERGLRRRCGRDVRACAARSCRSNRGCR